MQNKLKYLLKDEPKLPSIRTRGKIHLAQGKTADMLVMSARLSMCGALTTVLLLSEHEDLYAHMKGLHMKLKESYRKEVYPA